MRIGFCPYYHYLYYHGQHPRWRHPHHQPRLRQQRARIGEVKKCHSILQSVAGLEHAAEDEDGEGEDGAGDDEAHPRVGV